MTIYTMTRVRTMAVEAWQADDPLRWQAVCEAWLTLNGTEREVVRFAVMEAQAATREAAKADSGYVAVPRIRAALVNLARASAADMLDVEQIATATFDWKAVEAGKPAAEGRVWKAVKKLGDITREMSVYEAEGPPSAVQVNWKTPTIFPQCPGYWSPDGLGEYFDKLDGARPAGRAERFLDDAGKVEIRHSVGIETATNRYGTSRLLGVEWCAVKAYGPLTWPDETRAFALVSTVDMPGPTCGLTFVWNENLHFAHAAARTYVEVETALRDLAIIAGKRGPLGPGDVETVDDATA